MLALLAAAPAGAAMAPGDTLVRSPVVQLAWNAPFGFPRARNSISSSCRDTSRVDTLWLTFVTPYPIHLQSVSGALVFEPDAGDTLGDFWFFEREGANNGSLTVEFDQIGLLLPEAPWRDRVPGHVGYTRAGGRGRLDLSANGQDVAKPYTLPGYQYLFAKALIDSRHAALAGCHKSVTIRWIGSRFTTLGDGDLHGFRQQGQQVTWNASRGAMARDHMRLAIETWTPVVAPPSWKALFNMHPGIAVITRTPRDSVSLDDR